MQPTAPRPPHYKSDVHTTAPCRPLTYTCNDNNINIINSLTFLGQEVCLENKTIILKAPNNQNFLSLMKVTYFCFYDNTNLYSMRPYSSIIYHSVALILSNNNTSILQITFFVKLINDHRHRLYHFRTWLNENWHINRVLFFSGTYSWSMKRLEQSIKETTVKLHVQQRTLSHLGDMKNHNEE